VSLLDSQSGEVLLSWIAHPEWITDIAWSPDGRRLATASSDNSAKIWDTATGQLIQELRGITRGATVVAWSPDAERVATGSAQGISTIWDPESGEKLLTLKQPNPDHLFRFDITRVVFSPDGQRIATSSLNKTATVWDAYTGRELFTLTLDHSAGGVAFSPDSQRLATSSGGSLILWKFSNGGLQQERVFAGGDQAGRMTTITFSPDGTLLASGDYEGKVRVWDLKSGLKRLDIATFIDEVNWVAFSPDGRRLVASSAGKTSYFYTLSLNELIELTRSRLLRPMTPEECQSYLHKKTCPPWP
jgi:WD40 repeat protein